MFGNTMNTKLQREKYIVSDYFIVVSAFWNYIATFFNLTYWRIDIYSISIYSGSRLISYLNVAGLLQRFTNPWSMPSGHLLIDATLKIWLKFIIRFVIFLNIVIFPNPGLYCICISDIWSNVELYILLYPLKNCI